MTGGDYRVCSTDTVITGVDSHLQTERARGQILEIKKKKKRTVQIEKERERQTESGE